MPLWAKWLPELALGYRVTSPDDADLDAFDAGKSTEAREVTHYFKSRQWFDIAKSVARPPTYQFGTANDIVGYVATAFANKPHPREDSEARARYLVMYVLGIHRRFQGQQHAESGERYSTTILRALETDFAPKKSACVGIYLRVRTTNTPAIHFYERMGFSADPNLVGGTPDEAPQLVMRKLFPKPTP